MPWISPSGAGAGNARHQGSSGVKVVRAALFPVCGSAAAVLCKRYYYRSTPQALSTSAMRRRISRRIAAASLRRAMASADLRPCFQFARRSAPDPRVCVVQSRAAVYPAAAIRHGGTTAGRSTAGAGATPDRFPSRLKGSSPTGLLGFIAALHRSPPQRAGPPWVELLTAPATIAWPPSDTCTCCTFRRLGAGGLEPINSAKARLSLGISGCARR